MQKKIIALAVAGLVSGSAFAQSNVTISGLFDAGVWNTKSQAAAGGDRDASKNAAYNGTGTSNITFAAREDLGGGLRAGFLAESDLRGAGTVGGFQHYVFIGKAGIGDLSLGQRTNMVTTAAVTVQPFGTAPGGGWGSDFVRTRGGGFEAGGAWVATGRDVRPDAAAHFRSDSFNGVSFGLDFKPTNDGANETQASSGYLGLGLNYNNGPLNLTFANSKAKNTTAAVAAGPWVFADANANGTVEAGELTSTAAVAGYNSVVKNTVFGGNYTFGAATVYAGWTRSKADTAAAAGDEADSASWNIAVKYALNANLSLAANFLRDNDKLVANVDRKMNALGADYAFSKRTSAYFRYTNGDTNTNNSTMGKFSSYGFGLKHAF